MPPRFQPQSFGKALDISGGGQSISLERILAEGSKSFHTASKLLPPGIRTSATALYAFCRIADDIVDDAKDGGVALTALRARLDDLYAGRLTEHPLDFAFYETISTYAIPKAIFLAMFDGFVWDSENRRYDTIEDTLAYCARVASTVGVMMSLVMGERRPAVLAGACDLGLAMQLMNICRDVGEDADRGRVYLPSAWLEEAGIDRDGFLAHPVFTPALGEVVRRTLAVARHHFTLADIAIHYLPRDTRLAIRAAALIYADIGRVIRNNGYDTVTARAYTSKFRKVILLFRAVGAKFWRARPHLAPAHPSVEFLIDAVSAFDAASSQGSEAA